jgi:predicted XRE-type DNA-binding protein
MHPYAIDSEERRYVLLGIALVSVGLAYGFHWLMLHMNIQAPWWVELPSVPGIAGVLYEAFDKWLWRWFRKIGIVKIPDIQGQWEVDGYTSFEQKRSFKAKVIIRQTWTHISVYLETEQSSSRSLAASLSFNQPEGAVLIYHYLNEPKPNAMKTMHAHKGTAILRLKNDECMEGDYYSGRDRQNYGRLTLRRVSKNL